MMGSLWGSGSDPADEQGALSAPIRSKFNHIIEGIAALLVNWSPDSAGWTLRDGIGKKPGELVIWTGPSLPSWLASPLPQIRNIIELPTLAALYGTMYGGNGTTTFGMPPIAGRVIGCAGQGSGLTNRAVGAIVGEEAHANSAEENGPHSHNTIAPLGTGGTGATGWMLHNGGSGTATKETTMQGSGQPHNNMQPTIFFLIGIMK